MPRHYIPKTGRRLSEEHKNKISMALTGKKLSEEHKKNISLGQMGEKSHNWKGGISLKEGYHKMANKRWYIGTNKKNVRLYNFRRRVLRDGRQLTLKTIQLVYEDNIKRYGTLTCYLCLNPVPFGKDEIDHKIPISRNGTNEYNNLEIACQKCNRTKYIKTEEEYRKGILSDDTEN